MIAATARRHGVDPRLALAISMQESGWNQRAGLGRQRRRHHAGHPVRRRVGLLPHRPQAQPARPAGQRHRRRRHAARPDPDRPASEDIAIAGYYQGLVLGAVARDVHRHQALRRRTSRRSRAVCDTAAPGTGVHGLPAGSPYTRRVSTAPTDGLVGEVLDGRYRVLERLADGGMATVYLAVDTRLDREVALKVMRPHLAQDEAFRVPLPPRGPLGRPPVAPRRRRGLRPGRGRRAHVPRHGVRPGPDPARGHSTPRAR